MLVELGGNATIDVTLDLAEMSFIDSTGVSVLVSALKRMCDAGGGLALQSPRAATMKVLEITGLTGVFTIHSEAASDTTSNGAHEVHPEDNLKPEVARSRTSPPGA